MIIFFELVTLFLFGLCIGSFLNVIILRLRSDEQWIQGRSHCMNCKAYLAAWDLIPLISFIVLHGKCRYCAVKISWQYPLVELASGVLCVSAYLALLGSLHGDSITMLLSNGTIFPALLLLRNIFFISILLVVFLTDLRWYAIYDSVIILGSAVAFASNAFMPPFFNPQYIQPVWLNLVVGTMIPAAFFGLQYAVSAGRWIGSGDILLGAMIGCILGFPQAIIALFIAYCSGALVGIALLLSGKMRRGSEVPFGTFLSAATVLMILLGDPIMAFISKSLYL